MRFVELLIGRRLASDDQEHQQISPTAGIPVLGLDALASAAYGPEAALTLLFPLGAAGLRHIAPITGLIIAVLVIVYLSYRQTIAAYPGGGGSYTVAKANLGQRIGLWAGAALALDYILNAAVAVSAGVGALVSAIPALLPHTLPLGLGILGLLTVVNLRGVREAGLAFMLPTYAFVTTLGLVVLVGSVKALASGGHPTPVEAPPAAGPGVAAVSGWLLVRAFASGCTAMTGVEAVSNGVPLFRQPRILHAQRTLTAIVVILVTLLAGIGFLAPSYGIVATEPGQPGYQSVLSMLVAAVFGRGLLYYVTMASVVAVLALSANTSFADFPRLCRVLAEDRFLPDFFAVRGRRLVYTQGIVLLALLAGALLVAFGGLTDHLIPLFAIGAFLAFTLSQAGMVGHWWRSRGPGIGPALPLNAAGAIATGTTLIVVVVSKFWDGAWLTIVVLPLMLWGFVRINGHYRAVAGQIAMDAPLAIFESAKPIVIVAAQSWNKLTERGLSFGLRLSPDVFAVQVQAETGKMKDLSSEWSRLVEQPARAAGLPAPRLVVLASTYRQFFKPLVDFVLRVRDENPSRDVVVVVPDLVMSHWYHALLHNNRGAVLRALLRLRGGPRVTVVASPFHLHE
jgi:amino acid transporter